MKLHVYLAKRPRDARAWPVVAEDFGIAYRDKHRVSDIFTADLDEDLHMAADFFDTLNLEAG